MSELPACFVKTLPADKLVSAARMASEINPANHAPIERLASAIAGFRPTPEQIAVVTGKYWGAQGVHLTVGFLDNPPADLRSRILQHMNAWGTRANVDFNESSVSPQVRITRLDGDQGGYWSYVGTDILSIESSEPTLNLEGFTMNTPESEFVRVVRHETGHTLGCPHEHMRRELVEQIDVQKAIDYFGRTQGWTPEEVRAQVLTPIEESSLWGTPRTDSISIMCYEIPGQITKDGRRIVGGSDIDESDYAFLAKVYPKGRSAPAFALRRPTGGAPPEARMAKVEASPVLLSTEKEVSAAVASAHGELTDPVLCFVPGTSLETVAAIVAALRKR